MRTKVYDAYLGQQHVGYLMNHSDGKTLWSFSADYIALGPTRPTLSLSFNDLNDESITRKRLAQSYISRQGLPVFFSNLLPEGGLREYIITQLGIHTSNEFSVLEYLHADLPGNLFLRESNQDQKKQQVMTLKEEAGKFQKKYPLNFSLAGVQIKFSMLRDKGHFTLSKNNHYPDWIVKTPSIIHSQMPENEYSCMRLAEAIGIQIPDIQLVPLQEIGLPPLNLPDESRAYAIKRFDRGEGSNIHVEDIAQVFGIRSHEKYTGTNYEAIAKILLNFSKNGMEDVIELLRRIFFNILIANTDAHLKNFALIYEDARVPTLSPAYDLISSLGYIDNTELALNFARVKSLYQIDESVLKYFAKRISISEKLVLRVAKEVVSLAQEKWPDLLKTLPLPNHLLTELHAHWQRLDGPFHLYF